MDKNQLSDAFSKEFEETQLGMQKKQADLLDKALHAPFFEPETPAHDPEYMTMPYALAKAFNGLHHLYNVDTIPYLMSSDPYFQASFIKMLDEACESSLVKDDMKEDFQACKEAFIGYLRNPDVFTQILHNVGSQAYQDPRYFITSYIVWAILNTSIRQELVANKPNRVKELKIGKIAGSYRNSEYTEAEARKIFYTHCQQKDYDIENESVDVYWVRGTESKAAEYNRKDPKIFAPAHVAAYLGHTQQIDQLLIVPANIANPNDQATKIYLERLDQTLYYALLGRQYALFEHVVRRGMPSSFDISKLAKSIVDTCPIYANFSEAKEHINKLKNIYFTAHEQADQDLFYSSNLQVCFKITTI